MSQHIDNHTVERDHIQHNLISNDNYQPYPLIPRIDQQKVKSIEKIRKVDDESRQELRLSLDWWKQNISRPLGPIADEIKGNRKMYSYTAINST